MIIFALIPLIKMALLSAILWAAGLVYFVQSIPEAPIIIKKNYDVIIVLTGGKDRIPYALQLLQEGKGQDLFISGVADGFNVGEFERGLSPALKAHIFYGNKAQSTIGNADETAKWLKKRNYHSLLIVTANYHLPRTKLLFNHYLQDYEKKYASVVPPDFKLHDWLQHENSRRLVFSEYNKLLITWVKVTLNISHDDLSYFNL
jgi:uncharacterized SAM-binding protein YcdF (DUF218 family)